MYRIEGYTVRKVGKSQTLSGVDSSILSCNANATSYIGHEGCIMKHGQGEREELEISIYKHRMHARMLKGDNMNREKIKRGKKK